MSDTCDERKAFFVQMLDRWPFSQVYKDLPSPKQEERMNENWSKAMKIVKRAQQ